MEGWKWMIESRHEYAGKAEGRWSHPACRRVKPKDGLNNLRVRRKARGRIITSMYHTLSNCRWR